MPSVDTYVGEILGGTGANANELRTGITGEQITGDAHGRFFESARLGRLFSGGMTTTSIANATFTTGTLDATTTPIIGLWNPSGNDKNLVVLQARLQMVVTATTATGCGAFMWLTSTLNAAISTGITPLNRKTLLASGSIAKVYAGTALTGLTTALLVREASGMQCGQIYNATQTPLLGPGAAMVENIDGAFIIPPGGLLSLQCTTTPVAHSAASSILWEEVPILT